MKILITDFKFNWTWISGNKNFKKLCFISGISRALGLAIWKNCSRHSYCFIFVTHNSPDAGKYIHKKYNQFTATIKFYCCLFRKTFRVIHDFYHHHASFIHSRHIYLLLTPPAHFFPRFPPKEIRFHILRFLHCNTCRNQLHAPLGDYFRGYCELELHAPFLPSAPSPDIRSTQVFFSPSPNLSKSSTIRDISSAMDLYQPSIHSFIWFWLGMVW